MYVLGVNSPEPPRRPDGTTAHPSAAIASALFGLAAGAVRRAPRDLTITSAATLATVDRTGPRRITELATIAGVTQPAMTALVRVMERTNLVERRNDPADGRATLVALTDDGTAYVRARRQRGIQEFTRLIDRLSEEEVDTLTAALPALQHLAVLGGRGRHDAP